MAKKLLRVLSGEPLWPPPAWLMRQAGRYLPEYRELRARAGSFLDLCTNPDLATEVTLQPIRRFGFDAAILFSDILLLPWALGQGLDYVEGRGPVLPPLATPADLARLDPARAAAKLGPVLETVHRVRGALEEETLIGFAGAPFTVACYMVEGSGSRNWEKVRAMAWGQPALFGALIDLLVEQTIAWLAAQIEAGAEAVMLFDSWAGILAPDLFRAHVIEPTARIVAALRARYPEVPIIGFPRKSGLLMLEYVSRTGVQGVGMDTSIDAALAARKIAPKVALQGNLDPQLLVEGGPRMAHAVARLLSEVRGHPFIFNLGHGVVPETPVENITALLAQVRADEARAA